GCSARARSQPGIGTRGAGARLGGGEVDQPPIEPGEGGLTLVTRTVHHPHRQVLRAIAMAVRLQSRMTSSSPKTLSRSGLRSFTPSRLATVAELSGTGRVPPDAVPGMFTGVPPPRE